MKKLKYRKVGKAKPEPPLTTNKSGKVFITKAKKIDYLQNAMGAAILAAAQRAVRAEGAETQRDNAMIQLRQAVKNEERAKREVVKLKRKRMRDNYKRTMGYYNRETVVVNPKSWAQMWITSDTVLRDTATHIWKREVERGLAQSASDELNCYGLAAIDQIAEAIALKLAMKNEG